CRRQVLCPLSAVLLFPRAGAQGLIGRYWLDSWNLTGKFTLLPALPCQFALRTSRTVTPLSEPGGGCRSAGHSLRPSPSFCLRRSRTFSGGNCCRSAPGAARGSSSPAAARAGRASSRFQGCRGALTSSRDPRSFRSSATASTQRYLYLSPFSRGLSAGEGTGRMLRRATYLLPGGAYLLRARKRLYTLTPVRPRLREKPAVIGGLVKPTTRTQA